MACPNATTRRRRGRPFKLKDEQICLLEQWLAESPQPTLTEMARRLRTAYSTVRAAVTRIENNEGQPVDPTAPTTPEGPALYADVDDTTQGPSDQEEL